MKDGLWRLAVFVLGTASENLWVISAPMLSITSKVHLWVPMPWKASLRRPHTRGIAVSRLQVVFQFCINCNLVTTSRNQQFQPNLELPKCSFRFLTVGIVGTDMSKCVWNHSPFTYNTTMYETVGCKLRLVFRGYLCVRPVFNGETKTLMFVELISPREKAQTAQLLRNSVCCRTDSNCLNTGPSSIINFYARRLAPNEKGVTVPRFASVCFKIL